MKTKNAATQMLKRRFNQLWYSRNNKDSRAHIKPQVVKELCELGKILGEKAIGFPGVFRVLEYINISEQFPSESPSQIADALIERFRLAEKIS